MAAAAGKVRALISRRGEYRKHGKVGAAAVLAGVGGSLAVVASGPDGVDGALEAAQTVPRSARTLYTWGRVVADYKMTLASLALESEEYVSAAKTVHERSARRVLDMCQKNGGVYVKAGQLAASVRTMPEEYRKILSSLETSARARPVRAGKVNAVLRKDMGAKNPKDLFVEFCESAVAAGSIAQVHRAEVEGFGAVAVKVQYPGLYGAMGADISLVRFLALAGSYLGSDWRWLAKDLQHRLRQELDFREEAENAKRFAANFGSNKDVSVPCIDEERSGRRVLVTEWIDGCKISDKESIIKMGLDPREVGIALVRAFAEMTFIHGFVHGDPHPGNILVRKSLEDGKPQIILLDAGSCIKMGDSLRRNFCAFWRACCTRDLSSMEEACEGMGLPRVHAAKLAFFITRAPQDKVRANLPSMRKRDGETRRQRRRRMKENIDDFSSLLDSLPRNFLQLLRVTSLIRHLSIELGVKQREVLYAYATYAAQGRRSAEPSSTLFGILDIISLYTDILSLGFVSSFNSWIYQNIFARVFGSSTETRAEV